MSCQLNLFGHTFPIICQLFICAKILSLLNKFHMSVQQKTGLGIICFDVSGMAPTVLPADPRQSWVLIPTWKHCLLSSMTAHSSLFTDLFTVPSP